MEGLHEGKQTDPFFDPIFQGATASPGQAVDSRGRAVQHTKGGHSGRADVPRGGTFIIWCGLLYRAGQGSVVLSRPVSFHSSSDNPKQDRMT